MISIMPLRGCDPAGCGDWHSPRGKRLHEGLDLWGIAGSYICSLFSGTVTKVGYSKPNNWTFRYIEIQVKKNPRYKIRYHYVEPAVEVGDQVKMFTVLGTLQSVTSSYKNKHIKNKDHVHFEIWKDGKRVNPKEYLKPKYLRLIK